MANTAEICRGQNSIAKTRRSHTHFREGLMSTLFRRSPHRFIRKFARTLYLLAFLLIPVDSPAQVSVWTNHNDNARTGANLSESILNTSNVNVNQFGKLLAYAVDGSVYSQPLYIPNVAIPNVGTRNV